MRARTRLRLRSVAVAFASCGAALLALSPPTVAAAQVHLAAEEARWTVVAEHGGADAPVVARAVLTNAADVERRARRWYGTLDGSSTLGEGSVVVYARVLADGSVAEAFVPAAGPHHPAFNSLARRLAMTMRFAPVATDGSPIGTESRGARGYWVAQRIDFRH